MARTKNATATAVVVNRRGRPANVIVEDGGNLYSLSPAMYTKVLGSVAKGRKPNLKRLGAKPYGTIRASLASLTADEATAMLTPVEG